MERNLRSEMETVFIVTFRTGDICKPIHENCYFCTFPPRMTTGYLGETDFFFFAFDVAVLSMMAGVVWGLKKQGLTLWNDITGVADHTIRAF